ncbi:MAG: imidazoleglycerol-phosphate dehydratase HisB [Candidatus Aminicenantes bacterium]|nr:imidazoleglycerol-phosphate dehydratase HisB [Candidatus Aminicenantes bacterium]
MRREAEVKRKSKETSVSASVVLEGSGQYVIRTPIGFFNHMIESFAKHGLFDLTLIADGDLKVDQHHLIEDCGLVLGRVFSKALGSREGINRAGYFVYPMDEALAVVAVDLSGRPYLQYETRFKRRYCGDLDNDLLEDFFQAFAIQLRANVVVRMPFGRSDHHKMEAVFKALGRSMRMACSKDIREGKQVPSVKGLIDENWNR